MKFALAALIANVSAVELLSAEDYKFMSFVTEQGRSFATKAEYEFRLNVFKQRLATIDKHNSEGHSWTLGVNHFTDRTDEEIKVLNGFKTMENVAEKQYETLDESNLAASVDWRQKNAVTPVKNQGQCGSCWSFSTTGAMEGAHAIKTGKLVSLSEQNLVDCSKSNHGCQGGLMDNAFKYTETHPLETEAEYPYTAHKSLFFPCKYDASKGAVGATSFKDVPQSSPAQLKAFLNKGPVSVAIEADKSVFNQYKSGVITGSACGTSLDHGVLAVGYGTDANGTDYYIVKNSWGPSWGESGFVRLGIEAGAGVCGIQLSASQPYTN